MGIFTPETVCCCFDSTAWVLRQQFAQRRFDRGIGNLGNTPVQERDVTEQNEVSR